MLPSNDLSRSLVPLACKATVVTVVELSQRTWLTGGTEDTAALSWPAGQPPCRRPNDTSYVFSITSICAPSGHSTKQA
jgi:hypothetical protein